MAPDDEVGRALVEHQLVGSLPWGILLVTDDLATDRIPTWEHRQQVTESPSALVVKVMHEVDGPVRVRLSTGRNVRPGIEAYAGRLTIPSGRSRVSDATGDQALRLDVPPGVLGLRVYLNATESPDEVAIEVDL